METLLFHICPGLGSLLFLAEDRPFRVASTRGPRGSQTLSTGNSHYGGKGMCVESVRLDCSTWACQLCDFGQANLLL